MTSSNPAFSQDMFAGYDQVYGVPRTRSTITTVQGTVGKTFLLLAILSFTAIWSWNAVASGTFPIAVLPISAIGGFIVAMITIFKPTAAPVTAPIYAAVEGVFLGALSQIIEHAVSRQVSRASRSRPSVLTCGTLFVMLFVYQTGLVRVTEKLKAGIITATGALALFYLVTMLLSLFGVADAAGLQRDPDGDRLQPAGGRPGGVQPAAGLRLHREGRLCRRAQVHGVVRRLRPDGHPDLAVPGDPPAAAEAGRSQMTRYRRG